MGNGRKAMLGLRIITGLTIGMGLVGIIAGLGAGGPLFIVGLPVPAWALGACVTYLGVRKWFRLSELEKKMPLNISGGR